MKMCGNLGCFDSVYAGNWWPECGASFAFYFPGGKAKLKKKAERANALSAFRYCLGAKQSVEIR